jgi:hypothetical protein
MAPNTGQQNGFELLTAGCLIGPKRSFGIGRIMVSLPDLSVVETSENPSPHQYPLSWRSGIASIDLVPAPQAAWDGGGRGVPAGAGEGEPVTTSRF